MPTQERPVNDHETRNIRRAMRLTAIPFHGTPDAPRMILIHPINSLRTCSELTSHPIDAKCPWYPENFDTRRKCFSEDLDSSPARTQPFLQHLGAAKTPTLLTQIARAEERQQAMRHTGKFFGWQNSNIPIHAVGYSTSSKQSRTLQSPTGLWYPAHLRAPSSGHRR